MSTEQTAATPRQTLSVTDACAMIVGLIVGAGIFGTPSIVAGAVGDPSTLYAVWIAGGSRTMWGTVPLPVELTVLNAFACFLHTDVITMIPSSTTAAGVGILSVPIPGVTLRGKKFYSQWFLLDLGAPNGVLSGTQALWHIFG